jgi:hypothetical protein
VSATVRLQERLAAAEAARFERAFNHSSKRFEKDERVVSTGFLTLSGVALSMSQRPAAASSAVDTVNSMTA